MDLRLIHTTLSGASQVAGGEEPICQCRRQKRPGLSPWVWQTLRGGHGYAPMFLPGEEPGGLHAVQGGHKESDLTERT